MVRLNTTSLKIRLPHFNFIYLGYDKDTKGDTPFRKNM